MSLRACVVTGFFSVGIAGIVVLIWTSLTIGSEETIAYLYITGMYVLVHLVVYIVFGSVFYLIFWDKERSWVWTFRYGVPMGFVLGFFGGVVAFMVLTQGGKSNSFDAVLIFSSLAGVYGLFTALVAVIHRRIECDKCV